MKIVLSITAASMILLSSLNGVLAANHEVRMFTKNPDNPKERNVFVPSLLVVEPGDTVTFIAADKGHNSASGEDMIPEGPKPWKGRISMDIEMTLEKEGVYGYVCTPHEGVGMVGVIVVKGDGMLDNLDAVKQAKMKGKAKKVFADLLEEVEALEQ